MHSALLADLLAQLERDGVRFCHWKSNYRLREALSAGGDLDLLVDQRDIGRFEATLASLGFVPAVDPVQGPIPWVSHQFGWDEAAGSWLHLHTYHRIVTGGSYTKSYVLPLEGLLLADCEIREGVPVPQRAAELLLFVVRTMVKHSSPLDYISLRREGAIGDALRQELRALTVGGADARAAELLADWLPLADPTLFRQCIEAIESAASIGRMFWLGLRVRRQLAPYRRVSPARSAIGLAAMLARNASWRLRGRGKSKRPASGGLVIAFVGPEATGKSTLVSETARWLGQRLDTRTAHLGKPPSTLLTCLPNLVVPLLRRYMPSHRTIAVEREAGPRHAPRHAPLLYCLRALLDAYDRRALARRIRSEAAEGTIVVCDRYPSSTVGAMDSARLRAVGGSEWRDRLTDWLARLEQGLYREIPSPDLVFELAVPVDLAVERNRARHKPDKESDEYVRRRHESVRVPAIPARLTIRLDSSQPLEQTASLVRKAVWDMLGGKSRSSAGEQAGSSESVEQTIAR